MNMNDKKLPQTPQSENDVRLELLEKQSGITIEFINPLGPYGDADKQALCNALAEIRQSRKNGGAA